MLTRVANFGRGVWRWAVDIALFIFLVIMLILALLFNIEWGQP